MSNAMAAAECIDDLKKAGLDYDQARILVNFIVRSQEHLATKEDIKALEVNMKALEVKMRALEASLIRQLYVFGFGIIGSMIAIMGLFVALQSRMQVPM